MDTITKGRLGYNLLEKELLKRNWEIYTPILENTKIDCIIIKSTKLFKIQIKTIQTDKNRKILPVRKINYNKGYYKIHLYDKTEIDYFVGVDIETDDLYIVPIEFIMNYKSAISIKNLEPYKNNFSQMEPCVGNIASGEDDIGESLTANAEGTE